MSFVCLARTLLLDLENFFNSPCLFLPPIQLCPSQLKEAGRTPELSLLPSRRRASSSNLFTPSKDRSPAGFRDFKRPFPRNHTRGDYARSSRAPRTPAQPRAPPRETPGGLPGARGPALTCPPAAPPPAPPPRRGAPAPSPRQPGWPAPAARRLEPLTAGSGEGRWLLPAALSWQRCWRRLGGVGSAPGTGRIPEGRWPHSPRGVRWRLRGWLCAQFSFFKTSRC